MTVAINSKSIENKLERYCAYQERCRQEVSIKLQQLGIINHSEKEKIIRQLEENGFVDEMRYARAFARDKFNLNGWGKIKIAAALQQKNIPQKNIEAGLGAIDASEYLNELKTLAKKKSDELRGIGDAYIRKNKIAAYLAGRGFEKDLIWDVVEAG